MFAILESRKTKNRITVSFDFLFIEPDSSIVKLAELGQKIPDAYDLENDWKWVCSSYEVLK